MNASWRREGSRLIVAQNLGWVWLLRIVIGGPIFYFGAKMAWYAVSEPVHRFTEGGWSAVIGWLPSTFFTVLFAALLLPLGWWILAFRRYIVVDPEKKQISIVKDWRLGRKVTAHDIAGFRLVSVARDYVLSVKESANATNRLAHYVRVMPRDPKALSILIAMFSPQDREQPETLGREVAQLLGLQVAVNLDQIAKMQPGDEEE